MVRNLVLGLISIPENDFVGFWEAQMFWDGTDFGNEKCFWEDFDKEKCFWADFDREKMF
jgi:hypothetical protein